MDVYNKHEIAHASNDFLRNIGQKLVSQIPKSSKIFERYIKKVNVIMNSKPLSINELKDVFFSLKIKAQVLTMLVLILLKNALGVIYEPLIYLFQLSFEKGVFPDDLIIAKVTPIYKVGDSSGISNYRPISVLACFSKILECLMYNRLYKYLKEKIFFMKNSLVFKANIPPTMLRPISRFFLSKKSSSLYGFLFICQRHLMQLIVQSY